MKNKIATSLLLLSITFALTGRLNAMDVADKNPNPLKRSRLGPSIIAPSKADFIMALDKAAHEIDENGCTALHAASASGDLNMCKKLLSRGANPCALNNKKQSSLHCAVEGNHYKVVQQLIDGMPRSAQRKRLMAALCIMYRNALPKDLRLLIASYLPELITAYPRLCQRLVPHFITFAQLHTARYAPEIKLLSLKDDSGQNAYAIAKNARNGFMARMTNPENRIAVCNEQLNQLLDRNIPSENKENKE